MKKGGLRDPLFFLEAVNGSTKFVLERPDKAQTLGLPREFL
jgi:hypothetical protein